MALSTTLKQFGTEPTMVLQPDYSLTDNGYGLLQLNANFAYDMTWAGQAPRTFRRGAGWPVETPLGGFLGKHAWTCVRAEEKGRDGNVIMATAHYAAVSIYKGGECTETEATLTAAVVSEPIESHPNFTKIQIESIGSGAPLGGKWVSNKPPAIDDSTNNLYRALWQQSVNTQAGAIAWNFLGFSPSDNTTGTEVNRKAGVRTWMRPTLTMRLTGYTTNGERAAAAARKTWWVTKDGVDFLVIPDTYKKLLQDDLGFANMDVSKKKPNGKNWLVTSSNMEVYGGLYKVTADLLLSGVAGWDADIYPYMYAI